MARLTKSERLAQVHAQALEEFDVVQSALRDERKQCLEDRRFYSINGAQWEGNLGEVYKEKPKFEVNKIALSVIRIISEYRNNRVTVNFVSKDGTDNTKLADVCNGLYRADEHDSIADEAYDNGFEEGVGGGFGAWRLRTVYEDEEDGDNDHQRIQIEPIFDADASVFFDLNAKRQDKADARHCFVIYSMTVQSFIDEWGEDPTSWPKSIETRQFDWCTPDDVYVAEYYKVEDVGETIRTFRSIDGEEKKYRMSEFSDNPTLEDELFAIGSIEIGRRKIKSRKIRKYIVCGGKVLEDCGYIAGKCIPIVPVYGKRWFVDNIERCMGHVRLAKDAQRLKNMQLSKLGEISALSSVEKPMFTPEQIAGHEGMWSQDNLKNYPYLLVNPVTNVDGSQAISGPVAYTRSPAIPPAMAALLQITEQDMRDILGNAEAGEQVVSNVSGKAVEMIQQRLDMQTFIYMSNFSKAMKRCGEIWLSMAREVYVEDGRKMKVLTEYGEASSVTLMQPYIEEKTGATTFANDLTAASFDVDVDVGPSSSTKRSATVRAITGMMQITQDQETLQVLGAMAMMNMEGEGVSDVQDYFRQRLIKMGVVKPTEAEQKELMEQAQANEQNPDPNATYLKAAADEAEAHAANYRAKTGETAAATLLKQTQAARTMAETTEKEQEIAERALKGIIDGTRPNL